jgi:hypothetical protein
MARYLLAAEADKIQDFIFRASKLREVVGGSRLLSRFCDEGVKHLTHHPVHADANPEVIISDGGAFRIGFDSEEQARAFGRDLAELYRRCAGGTLTIATPVSYENENEFPAANEEAQRGLREAKSRGRAVATIAHLPYIAFCASCGLAVAIKHRPKIIRNITEPETVAGTADRANYICADCLNKAEEKHQGSKDFIGRFRKAVKERLPDDWTGDLSEEPQKRDWTDRIRRADPRNYVAYLVADGNGMGKLFSKCNKEQLKALSLKLTEVLRDSLAAPCAEMLIKQQGQKPIQDLGDTLPVVPLILGGDDLFALLPAPFALSLASKFCRAYEINLKAALTNLEIDGDPTITAAMVICKSTYPHTLAHKRAGEALKDAKRLARRLEVDNGQPASALNFEIVTGNQVIAGVGETNKSYRSTLRPYFVNDNVTSEWGVNIERLLKARFGLRDMPGKRRAEFERLYAELPEDRDTPRENGDLLRRWKPQFDRFKLRSGIASELDEALVQLGDEQQKDFCYWKEAKRSLRESWFGHGLPDLLEAWDFAFQIDQPLTKYEEE